MDNRRLLLASILSVGVILLWYAVFPPPVPVQAPPPAVTEAPAAEEPLQPEARSPQPTGTAEPSLAPVAEPIEATIEEIVEIETDHAIARLTNRGGQLVSLRLKADNATGGAELIRQRAPGNAWPLAWVNVAGEPLALNDALFEVETRRSDGGREAVFRYRGALGEATRRVALLGKAAIEIEAEYPGSREPWGLLLGPGLRNPDLDFLSSRIQLHGAVARIDGDLETLAATKVAKPRTLSGAGLEWIGLEDTYFLTALTPSTPITAVHVVPRRVVATGAEPAAEEGQSGNQSDADSAAASLYEYLPLSPDATRKEKKEPRDLFLVVEPTGDRLAATGFWGDKKYDELAAREIGLERTIRWGIFRPLSRPLLILLNWLHDNVTPNYGWCIVLMTLMINVVLFPLRHKSHKSMQDMQQLQPRMDAVRKKYKPKLRDKHGKADFEQQRKMNEEISALMREEGVNPAAGCLPMLVQFPVFLSFYYLLRGAVELWHAPWIGWIQDLSAPDPIYALPLIMGATQLVHTRLMPTPPQAAQRIVMTTMPIWFTVFALGFPAGLVLYWLTNNLLTIVQQLFYNRIRRAREAAEGGGKGGGKSGGKKAGGKKGGGKASNKGHKKNRPARSTT